APPARDGRRAADDRRDDVLQPGGGQRAPQLGQGVEDAAVVGQRRVVVLPADLVLLGAAVVVHGDDVAAGDARGVPEVDGRLAAVAADLDADPGAEVG